MRLRNYTSETYRFLHGVLTAELMLPRNTQIDLKKIEIHTRIRLSNSQARDASLFLSTELPTPNK